MSILAKIDFFDAIGAIHNFPSRDDFFIALIRASVEAESYLRDYNANVILFDQETKDYFLKELKEIRGLLISLNVKDAPFVLDGLAEAVDRMDSGSLIDGLRVFYAEMIILRESIHSALIPTH
jgi:hypothetical protein